MFDFNRNQISILLIPFLIFGLGILFCLPVFAQDEHLLRFYSLAVPAAQDFTKRTINESKTLPSANRKNFQVHNLFDNLEILTAANIDLPARQCPTLENAAALLRIAEEMQDQEPASATFGNFRWYWNTAKVTDRNAVVFVAARAIPCWFEGQTHYSDEAKTILKRILERSIAAALTHKVSPDYTNIAVSDAIVLIILGQIFNRADVIREGEKRLSEIQFAIWEHGIAEYNSPPYSAIDTDMLQLGLRYIQNETTKAAIRKMLDYLAGDFSLHWFRGALRLAGSQSRTYQYLHGVDAHSTRLAAIAGLGDFEPHAKYAAMLNSFRSVYKMPPEIAEWNGQFPRFIERRWGTKTGQWSATSLFDDIALGTAGASYHSGHSGSSHSGSDLLLTVDLPNEEQSLDLAKRHFLPRCYFIPDGRNDPFGTKHFPTGTAGHLKALHLNPVWIAAQRKTDALCFVRYPSEMLADSSPECLKSQFVLRQPDEQRYQDNTFCFRYQSAAVGIRILFAEDAEGKTANAKLISGETADAIRLEIDHALNKETNNGNSAPTGIFWIRIGSHIQDFAEWCNAFHSANVDYLSRKDNNIAVCVNGEFGKLSIHADTLNNTASNTENKPVTTPSAPTGILTRNGKDIGRPILEEIPAIRRFIQNYNNAAPVVVPASFEAKNAVSFFENKIEHNIDTNTDNRSDVQSMLLNNTAYRKIKVDHAGKYYLSCRVLAKDSRHDSLFLNIAEESPNLFWTDIVNTAWHLGSSSEWRDVRFAKPIELKAGTYRLALSPREPDVRIGKITIQQVGAEK